MLAAAAGGAGGAGGSAAVAGGTLVCGAGFKVGVAVLSLLEVAATAGAELEPLALLAETELGLVLPALELPELPF